jgi:hypothetical protein
MTIGPRVIKPLLPPGVVAVETVPTYDPLRYRFKVAHTDRIVVVPFDDTAEALTGTG